MTVLLVIITIAALLLLDWYLVRHRRVDRVPARATPGGSATDDRRLFFHPGHAWVRVHDDRLVTVGATEFAANFAGALRTIDLPAEGATLRAGEPAWTLVSSGGRRLRQVMPVDGEVVAVNKAVARHPTLTQRSSYDAGWVLRIRPRNFRRALRRLLAGAEARDLMDDTLQRLNARLWPAVGAVAQDGGEWAPGFGEHLDDMQWETLRCELFPDPEPRREA